jgi:hypothetical protein
MQSLKMKVTSTAYIGDDAVDIIPAGNDVKYYIPVAPIVKKHNCDLRLTLRFPQRVIAVFQYHDQVIKLVGKKVTFSGFKKNGEVKQFNLSVLRELQDSLTKTQLARAKRQVSDLLVNVYEAIPPPASESDDSEDEHDWAWDGSSDSYEAASDCSKRGKDTTDGKVVAYSNGEKSRINYHSVDDTEGAHLGTLIYTFVPKKEYKLFIF